jgi:hypothetical protein
MFMRYFGGGIGHLAHWQHLHAVDSQASNAMDVDISNGNEGQHLVPISSDGLQRHGLELLAQQAVHDWAGNTEVDTDEDISDEEDSSGNNSPLYSDSEDDEDGWDNGSPEDGDHDSEDSDEDSNGYGSP